MEIEVKVISKSAFELPKRETPGSAGMDIRANIKTNIELQPLERMLIPTGLFIEIPAGYECQVSGAVACLSKKASQ